jgi:hypothetical protein
VDVAERRLYAALALQKKLCAILEGQTPYDVFVRWRPVAQQRIGWATGSRRWRARQHPPVVAAGVLRQDRPPKRNIKWDQERGQDGASGPWFHACKGQRSNEHHLILAEELQVRRAS